MEKNSKFKSLNQDDQGCAIFHDNSKSRGSLVKSLAFWNPFSSSITLLFFYKDTKLNTPLHHPKSYMEMQ